jgi:hypothetical protein
LELRGSFGVEEGVLKLRGSLELKGIVWELMGRHLEG